MNPVLYWNAVLLEASRRDFTRGFSNAQQPGPIRTSYAMAIVHIAIHDTVAFRQNKADAAYLTKKLVTHGLVHTPGDLDDMIAGAATLTLKALYPKFTAMIDDSLGPVDPASFAFGQSVGTAVLKHRWGPAMDPTVAGDHSNDMLTKPQPNNPAYGAHRADPYQPNQSQLGPVWGTVTRFTGATNQPLSVFPGSGTTNYLGDLHYKKDFEEVRELGSTNRGARTAEQQRIGVYWGYDGANNLGVPPRLYNQILRALVAKHEADTGTPFSKAQAAELFAVGNVAMADAGIDAWHHKYLNNLWRPVTGIRYEPAPDGGDAFWAPLGAPTTNVPGKSSLTPPFPAYPSGHATFGAAVFQVAKLTLASGPAMTVADVMAYNGARPPAVPDQTFTFISDELDGTASDPDGATRQRVVKQFGTFAEAVWENAVSRVYLGVHWRFDGLPGATGDQNIGGVPLGLAIGAEAHKFFNDAPSLSGSA